MAGGSSKAAKAQKTSESTDERRNFGPPPSPIRAKNIGKQIDKTKPISRRPF